MRRSALSNRNRRNGQNVLTQVLKPRAAKPSPMLIMLASTQRRHSGRGSDPRRQCRPAIRWWKPDRNRWKRFLDLSAKTFIAPVTISAALYCLVLSRRGRRLSSYSMRLSRRGTRRVITGPTGRQAWPCCRFQRRPRQTSRSPAVLKCLAATGIPGSRLRHCVRLSASCRCMVAAD